MIDIPTSYRRRFGAAAPRVAQRLIRTYGHLALALATEIYDEPGDLEPDETTFLIEVHAASRIKDRAERDEAYQAALDKYELMTFRPDEDEDDMLHAYPVETHSRKNLLDVEVMYETRLG